MIHIGMDPTIFTLGPFQLTWHSFFAFLGVVLAIYLAGRWARNSPGVNQDMVYATAVWALIGGIVGARFVHVIDHWSFYTSNPAEILAIYKGGIALYGAILGAFVGGAAYAYLNKFPVGKLADLAAPVVLLAQGVGRIGDIINGEHCSVGTTMPWGFVYTHPNSEAFASCYNTVRAATPSTHPAVAYELIWDLLAFAVLWRLRGRLQPDGMLFALYLALYSTGRFFISFFRTDKVWVIGLQEAQLIAVLVLAVTVPLLAYRASFIRREVVPEAPSPRSPRRRRQPRR